MDLEQILVVSIIVAVVVLVIRANRQEPKAPAK